MRLRGGFVFCAALLTLRICAARAADEPFRIDYTVDVASIEEQRFHVSAELKNIHQDSVEVSLPVWTPGWYTLENYARNMSRFIVHGPGGERLNHQRTHKQAWRFDTRGLDRVTIEFDYQATKLALNQARIDTDYAFFTGTQLFLMVEGHRECGSQIHVKCPANWKTFSALKESPDPDVFSAANYDELVDCPVLMGAFDARKFDVRGKPHWLVTLPKGKIQEPRAQEMVRHLTRIVEAGAALFGDLPYDKYAFFYFFKQPETRASGGLEHANSHICFFAHGETTSQNAMDWMSAHEFFHVWNVKRIRPAQLWPYDYSRESETPLLWVSEGFTTYYGSVLLLRAGLSSRAEFYEAAEGSIAQIESTEPRNYIPPSDASMSTWLGYDNRTVFEISYYLTGRNLALLLDISILHDTAGQRGLDDVMRGLYADYYLKNKGFESSDLLAEINKISGSDYSEFFRKHVDGIERPPYEQILNFAGLKIAFPKRRDVFGNVRATISEIPDASDAQKKLRDAWLKK